MRPRLPVLAALAAVTITAAGAASAGPLRPAFTTAPHRNPPQLIFHGWAHKPLRIISFVPSTYPNAAGLQYFGNGLAQSKWNFDFTRAYGLPNGTIATGYQVDDMPTLTSHSSGATFQSYVFKKVVALAIPARPDRETIYLLYIPCAAPQSLDGFGCVSHHPLITAKPTEPQFGSVDSMAVVLGSPSTSTDSKTQTASHEIAEAATDRFPKGWFLEAANKDRPWLDSSAFIEDEGSGHIEVADMSQGAIWNEKYFSSSPPVNTTYSYSRIYANRRSRLGGDPAVPSSPEPYYNVTTKDDWPKVTAGSTKTVAVTGWSVKRIPAWTVTASVISWEGGNAAPDPCTIVGRTSWKVANGGTFSLKVKAKSGKAGKWCDVKLRSAAAPTADGDFSHPWFVGFHIV
jgi:hypothetical protein